MTLRNDVTDIIDMIESGEIAYARPRMSTATGEKLSAAVSTLANKVYALEMERVEIKLLADKQLKAIGDLRTLCEKLTVQLQALENRQ